MERHELHVERRGPQRFVAVCACGWVGRNRKGTEFWQSAGALGAVFKHQEEHGAEKAIPPLIDMDPDTSRRRRSW